MRRSDEVRPSPVTLAVATIPMDANTEIRIYNAGRDPERLAMKYAAMRASPFAFLRGTCHLFYAGLAHRGVFKSTPRVWSCGDLHLENFGSYKGDNRLAYFDINDFDEAALAPAACDLARLLTSLRLAADGSSIRAEDADPLCAALIDSYAAALASGKAYWIERETGTGIVRELLDGLRERQRPAFLDSRTQRRGRRRTLRIDGSKALPATPSQRARVVAFMAEFAKSQPEPAFYTVLDVARRIAGTGSLGVDRFVVLVSGKGSPDGNYLLDLKQALPSSLAGWDKADQPRWATEAVRTVTIQRRMQAVSVAFLHAVLFGEEPYVLRALQPSEDRVALRVDSQSTADLDELARTLGRVVAWAQLRSSGRAGSATADELVDFGERRKWRSRLLDASKDLAAQVRADSLAFDAAYDAGEFAVPSRAFTRNLRRRG